MRLVTKARDCLYVNWAVPREHVPEPPPPLRYEVHRWRGGDWVFASALLFRFDGLHARTLPFLRLSYPQMNLRLYVLDGDDVPSVLFVRMMVPYWVVPVSRFLGRQPAHGGLFDYPEPPLAADGFSGNGDGSRVREAAGGADEKGDQGDQDEGGDRWSWTLQRTRVTGAQSLRIDGRLASPGAGHGPDLGGWQRTVDYIRRRPVGYVLYDGKLRSLRKSHPTVPVWPLAAEVTDDGLLARVLPQVDGAHWAQPHSAWLCPRIPFHFEVGRPRLLPSLPQARRAAVAVPDGC